MFFSNSHWMRSYVKKMDSYLRKELVNSYRHNKMTPCFLHGLIYQLRFYFKKINVIIRYAGEPNSNILIPDNIRKIRELKSINAFSARLTPRIISKLLESKAVERIYLDRSYKALLDKASPSINAPVAWDTGLSGKGVTVAVIDTGIHPHDDLVKPANRILAFKDFVSGKSNPYDDNGHGTHVAGDIASNGFSSKGLYKAPAYQSNIVGVKVLDKMGMGNLSAIISGVEWCMDNRSRYNIRIINLSLGAAAQSSYRDDLMCEAVENAWKSGIVVCAAAGNEGPESGTIASPGIDPMILTVGAADDRNTPPRTDDAVADFSSRGPTFDNLEKPDVVCPGTNIISLRSPGSYLDKISSGARVGSSYLNLSGTSMATPLCCSAIAVLLESNPGLKPDDVKKVITGTASDMGYDKFTQGKGYLNIQSSILRGYSWTSMEGDPGIIN